MGMNKNIVSGISLIPALRIEQILKGYAQTFRRKRSHNNFIHHDINNFTNNNFSGSKTYTPGKRIRLTESVSIYSVFKPIYISIHETNE